MTFPNSGEERYFCKESNQMLHHKRNNYSENGTKKHKSKFTFDNLKRKSKHLVIENAMDFINKKIKEAYNGNIGEGIIKKELVKLKDEGYAITLAGDIARGKPEIARLKFNEISKEALYKANLESINATKLQIKILENQIEREWVHNE